MLNVVSGTYIDHIVKVAMLSDGPQNRLMVRTSVDRSEAVGSWGKTSSNVGTQDAVGSCQIKTFEEGELGWCSSGLRLQRINLFHNNV